METVKKGTKKPVCVGFKSYYVVWKLVKGEGIFQGDVWV